MRFHEVLFSWPGNEHQELETGKGNLWITNNVLRTALGLIDVFICISHFRSKGYICSVLYCGGAFSTTDSGRHSTLLNRMRLYCTPGDRSCIGLQ